MSLDPILWAMKDAPTADIEEWGVLTFLAEKADEDGCSALPSATTIARYTKLNRRTVLRRLDELERRGVIQRGDQSAAAYLPTHRQPTVYDLQIPCSWFSNIDRTNEFRAQRGRPPITLQTRPDLPPAPEPKPRSDKGKPKAPHQPGDSQTPHNSQSPRDSQTQQGVTHRHQGGDSQTPNPPHRPSPDNPPPSSAHSTPVKGSRNTGTAWEEADGDGVTQAARELLSTLPEPWRLGPKAVERLAPLAARALRDGWGPDDLAERLAANPHGVRHPEKCLQARLEDLPPPADHDPSPKSLAICPAHPHGDTPPTTQTGICSQHPDTRRRIAADGTYACPTCYPEAWPTSTPASITEFRSAVQRRYGPRPRTADTTGGQRPADRTSGRCHGPPTPVTASTKPSQPSGTNRERAEGESEADYQARMMDELTRLERQQHQQHQQGVAA